MYEVILWDIDGTLLMGGGVGRIATREALEAVFGTSDGLETHHFGGKTDWQTLLELMPPQGFSTEEIARRLPTYSAAIAQAMQRHIDAYDVRALPAALEITAQLHAHPRILQGIVTGNVQPNVPIKLRAAGFDPQWFPFGAYGDEHANRNALPPLAVQRAAQLNGGSISSERVLVVGDTLKDIEAARANGMAVCAVRTGFESDEVLRAAQPEYLLDDLTQFWERVPLRA